MRLLIIGAGGVASYLLPALFNTLRDQITGITMYDKDVVEERNLLRQAFTPDDVGQSKAHALRTKYKALLPNVPFEVKNQWFSESVVSDRGNTPDANTWIICIADNHTARRAAIYTAKRYGCNAIIGGNEYVSSQAYVFHQAVQDLDPTVRYDLSSNEGSPFRCNTEEALSIAPQLAMANNMCAALILQLLWTWSKPDYVNNVDLLPHLPIELYSNEFSVNRISVSNARRLLAGA